MRLVPSASLALAAVVAIAPAAPAAAAEPLPKPPSRKAIKREYFQLLRTFDPKLPGRGPDVLNFRPLPIPTAFASILRAEGLRYHATRNRGALRRVRLCGRWLLRNGDLNRDGIVGWGYPFRFERNGVVAPVNQEYTIVTSSMADALLDWITVDPRGAPRRRILRTIRRAFEPFVRRPPLGRSPTGFFAYSFFGADRPHDVYNVGAALAGQMRRFSNLVRDRRLRLRMRRAAGRNIQVLQRARLRSPNGNYYWYRTSRPPRRRPNSLGHALITINGIRVYWRAGGRQGFTGPDRIRRRRLLGHIREFLDGRELLTTPVWESIREPAFGSAGVGGAVVLAMQERPFRHLLGFFMRKLRSYEYEPGRYSTGFKIGPRSTVRGQAGVLSTFSRYVWGGRGRPIIDE